MLCKMKNGQDLLSKAKQARRKALTVMPLLETVQGINKPKNLPEIFLQVVPWQCQSELLTRITNEHHFCWTDDALEELFNLAADDVIVEEVADEKDVKVFDKIGHRARKTSILMRLEQRLH